MPESIDVTGSLAAIYEGDDNDRLEVLKQQNRDTSDVLSHSAGEDSANVDDLVAGGMNSMLLDDVAYLHEARFVELLDEDKRRDRYQAYNYTPLPSSRHIRLLQLESEFETFRNWSIIAAKLVAVSLDEAPKYEALSYTWGTSEKTVPVLIDDTRILVTPNLAVALQYSRERSQDESEHWLWIDQICINQSDLDERNQQVRAMREIYHKSSQTTIWLGLNHQSVQRLEDRLFSKVWPYIKSDGDVTKSLQPDLQFAAMRRPKELPCHDDEIWADLAELVQRPWFRRIWVVQEARASANKPGPKIRVGKLAIGWHYVALILSWLLQKGFSAMDKNLKPLLFPARIFNTGRRRLPLLRQLYETRQFCAKDARDKIFALIGIVQEGENEANLPECLQPDYTKSLQEIYQAVTVYLIKQSMDLQVLSYVQHMTQDTAEDVDLPEAKMPSDTMPSWVARWENEHANGSPIIDDPFFNASAGKVLDIKILKKQGGLKIKGVLFDRVSYVSKIFQNSTWTLGDEEKLATKNPVFDTWVEVRKRCGKYPNGDVTDEVFIMALLCGKHASGERATSVSQLVCSLCAYLHYAFIIRECYSTFKEMNLINADSSILKRVEATDNPISRAKSGTMIHRLHETLGHMGAGQDPNMFLREMSCTRQRKLLITATGYIGMGPAAMQEGDLVVILNGGRVPYILRAQGESFCFVGEAYVHGLMDGEGIKFANEKGVKPQYFELR